MDLERLRQDIIDSVGSIKEPDHPTQTLEELGIVSEEDIHLSQENKRVAVKIVWAPACQTCAFVNNIGLCMHYKLQQDFPHIKFRVHLEVKEGSHVNKAESND